MRRVNHSYFSFSNVGSYGSISADIYDISAVPTLCPTKVVRWDITLVTFVLDLFICVLPIPSLYPSLYPLIPLPPSLSLPSRFSTCPSIHLSNLSIYLSVCLSTYLSTCLFVSLSVSLFLSVHPFFRLSLFLYLSLSLCVWAAFQAMRRAPVGQQYSTVISRSFASSSLLTPPLHLPLRSSSSDNSTVLQFPVDSPPHAFRLLPFHLPLYLSLSEPSVSSCTLGDA